MLVRKGSILMNIFAISTAIELQHTTYTHIPPINKPSLLGRAPYVPLIKKVEFAPHINIQKAEQRKGAGNCISANVRDIRSFSGTKCKKNLEKWRAEPFLVYPLLYDPSVTQ